MLYLLQLEWLKQKKHKSFLLLAGLFLFLLPSSLLIAKSIKTWPPPINTPQTFFQFPDVFIYLGYVGNWLCFFLLGFHAVSIVTQEFGNRTLRQNIIAGLTRADVFRTKVSYIFVASFFATLYFGLVAFIFGLTHTDALYDSVVLKNIDYLPRFFLMCLGYMSFGLLLGTWIRRTGTALFLYFSYVLFIELILRWGVHMNLFQHRSMHFYPMNAIEDLAPIPFAEFAKGFEKQMDFGFFLSPQEAMITTSVYIILFLTGTYLLIAKRDL